MGMYICTVVDHKTSFFFILLQYLLDLLDFRLALMGVHVDDYWLDNYMNSVLNKFLSLSQNFIKIPTFLTVDLERRSMDMQAQYFFFLEYS